MGCVDERLALGLVKARLNRLPGDTSLDDYFQNRISAAVQEADRTGIHLTDCPEHLMYLVDYTVWQYQNRDKPGSMPEWLRLRRRELWLRDGGGAG